MKKLLVAIALALCSSQAHAFMNTDYYQAGANVFYCASTSTVANPTAAGISVNSPLVLQNPLGSGVKLVVMDVGLDVTASPAAATGLLLAYNLTTSTTILVTTSGTVTSAFVGASTGTFTTTKANCYVSSTLPATPTAFRYLGGTTGASAIGGATFHDPSYPLVVLPPGGIVSIQATSATSLIGDIAYIEVPF